jgi:hypothetical protein
LVILARALAMAASPAPSLDDLRAALARAGVRSVLSEEDLREILSSPASGASGASRGDASSRDEASSRASGGGGGGGDVDDLLSLPSAVLAELASPAPAARGARAAHFGDAARAPLSLDLRFE